MASLRSSDSTASLPGERHLRQRRRPGWVSTTAKVWLDEPRSRSQRWARGIVLAGFVLASLCIIGLAVLAYFSSNRGKYIDLMSGRVSSMQDWDQIEQADGSFEGSFDRAIIAEEVAWVKDGSLYIRPQWVEQTSTESLMKMKTNVTLQQPHIQTAQLRSKASITFGKAQVTAKFPKGDWLWSTISLEPAGSVYGAFPGSGRIDLVQIRGNKRGFKSGGIDRADHILHYGAAGVVASDCAFKDRYTTALQMTDFSSSFHTFGVEWTPGFIRLWLDFPSNAVLHSAYPRGFWRKTGFSSYLGGDPRLSYSDPWTNGTRAAPFDVPFRLVIRVNVGAVGGIFADVDEKPWYDAAGRNAAMLNFNLQNSTWLSTWGALEDHTLQVKSAKMSQQLSASSAWGT